MYEVYEFRTPCIVCGQILKLEKRGNCITVKGKINCELCQGRVDAIVLLEYKGWGVAWQTVWEDEDQDGTNFHYGRD